MVYTHSNAQEIYYALDSTRKRQVNVALQHIDLTDDECANLGRYVEANFNTNRIKFYYFESVGAWAKSRLDKSASPESADSFNEFRLASKSFNDTRQLTLTLLHEAFHLLNRLDNDWDSVAESTAQRCYLP